MRAPADETSSLYPRRSALSASEFYINSLVRKNSWYHLDLQGDDQSGHHDGVEVLVQEVQQQFVEQPLCW
jgi:hypothetical protein